MPAEDADRAALRARFSELAGSLPALAPGVVPPAATEYLDYYGLDFCSEFPAARHSLGFCTSGEHRLAVHCWQQPGAAGTLLLVHGYFDHVGLYGHLVRFGLARGSNVVAFDLPGHGLSSGPRGEIHDFSEYRCAIGDVMTCAGFVGGPWHVIAQSTGGAAVMEFLQLEPPAFGGVVLLAPLVRPHGWRRVWLAHTILHRFVDAVPRRFAENSQDPDFLDFLQRDPLQHGDIPVCWVGALRRWVRRFSDRPPCAIPILVLQGDNDGTVDWRSNLKIIAALFPAAQIETITMARHHLVNEDSQTRAEFLERVDRYLGSLPARP